MIAAQTPRTLWIELTSKCPLDCVFCSRKTRRGAGEHMPYKLVESLLGQLSAPRTLLLNYSGESTVYPELIPAIRLARSTGAAVELVSALVNVPESRLEQLCGSGLTRLTVSVHSSDPARYAAIYRYGSFEGLRTRLTRIMRLRAERGSPLTVDLAFVAMDSNLADLVDVAAFAQSLGVRDISVFPVIRRDEIPIQFPEELDHPEVYRPEFRERLQAARTRAESEWPEVSVTICNPWFRDVEPELGEAPAPFPGLLPPGALIHSCEQNPWETAHVLSNGDVVACEVLDRQPLGNIGRQSLAEIWHGDAYRRFRERYRSGEVPECRTCPWKRAYRAGPLRSEILGERGANAQLLRGWHEPVDESHVWASQEALAEIAPRPGSRVLHVSGMLPPGLAGEANELVISSNDAEVGRVANPWEEMMPFGLDFEIPPQQPTSWLIEFRTRHVFRPNERGLGPDQRDLGFALVLVTSKPFIDPEAVARRRNMLRSLRYAVTGMDVIGYVVGRLFRRRRPKLTAQLGAGISVVIPERDNVAELEACLASLEAAAARFTEPIEVIVVANGSLPEKYRSLQGRYPEIKWEFSERPLGFSRAVARGLQIASFDWVYLLNNDVVLDPDALVEASRHRRPEVFSIASQILLKDRTRFREETNWTSLFVENGLVAIHDRIPQSDDTVPGFYAGGGASLFQKRLLQQFVRVSVYEPFYWEDAEWGWRARKLGYGSLFCPKSIAHHTQRSTIDRHYAEDDIERVLQRNRLLFQLRNLTASGSISRVREEAALAPEAISRHLLRVATLWNIFLGRLWNHMAPVSDNELLSH